MDSNNSDHWPADEFVVDHRDHDFDDDEDSTVFIRSNSTALIGSNRTRRSSSLTSIVLTVIPVLVIIVLITCGNFLVIMAVLRDRRLRKQIQNWLIVSLSAADLLVGLVIMPVTLTYELMDYWIFGELLCEIWLASDVLFVTASILNLCAISLDRYWSLTDPIYYAAKRTRARISRMIACVWIVAFLVSCPLIVGWRGESTVDGDQCLLSEDLGYVLYSSCGSFFIPVLILLFVYARIYRITRLRAIRNKKRDRRREEMFQSFEEDQEIETSRAVPTIPELGGGKCAIDFESELSTAVESGSLGRGLLKVALDISAIAKPSANSSPTVAGHRRGTSLRRVAPPRKTSRGLPSESSRIGGTFRMKNSPSAPNHLLRSSFRRGDLPRCPSYRDRGGCVGAFDQIDTIVNMRSVEIQGQIGRRKKMLRRRERQATSLLGLIVVAFVGCWMPFFGAYVLRAVCCQLSDSIFDVIFWLGYCNSALNPVLYNFFNPDFRRAFVKILRRKRM